MTNDGLREALERHLDLLLDQASGCRRHGNRDGALVLEGEAGVIESLLAAHPQPPAQEPKCWACGGCGFEFFAEAECPCQICNRTPQDPAPVPAASDQQLAEDIAWLEREARAHDEAARAYEDGWKMMAAAEESRSNAARCRHAIARLREVERMAKTLARLREFHSCFKAARSECRLDRLVSPSLELSTWADAAVSLYGPKLQHDSAQAEQRGEEE